MLNIYIYINIYCIYISKRTRMCLMSDTQALLVWMTFKEYFNKIIFTFTQVWQYVLFTTLKFSKIGPHISSFLCISSSQFWLIWSISVYNALLLCRLLFSCPVEVDMHFHQILHVSGNNYKSLKIAEKVFIYLMCLFIAMYAYCTTCEDAED